MPTDDTGKATGSRARTLERLPGRVLSLLQGIAKYPSIRRKLQEVGYQLENQREGFALLQAAIGIGMERELPPPNDVPSTFDAVSAWYAPSFERIHAALTHVHPAQAKYVTRGLLRVTGPAALIASMVLLERLDDLAGTGPHAETRARFAKEDRQALATLATRGFDRKELKRASAMVRAAKTAGRLGGGAEVSAEEERKRWLELKGWYDDWAATARSVVKARGELIKLGLASRRTASE